MQLIQTDLTYELQYESTDTPSVSGFSEWQYVVQVLKACSPSITDVQQRGIYSPDIPRFALTVSTPLTNDEITAVLNAWETFDPVSYILEDKMLATEELRIQLGIKTKAYLGYLCEVKVVSVSDYESMLEDATLTILDRLLLNGALESAKGILDSYTPTSYFTADFQTAVSAKLAEYIDQVNAFIAS